MTLSYQPSLWTTQLVIDYLKEAAETLKRLPSASIKNRLASWPDVVRSAAELYYGQATAYNRLAPPTPDAISRMDAVLEWLLPLTIDERRILWARATGISWRRLEDIDGRSHVTLRKVYHKAVQEIVTTLIEESTVLLPLEEKSEIRVSLDDDPKGPKPQAGRVVRLY